MLKYDVFEKASILAQDIPYIMEIDKIYGDKVEEIAKSYKKELGNAPFEPFDAKTLWETFNRSKDIAQTVEDIASEHGYTLQLIFWLYLLPDMEEKYKKCGIDMQIFLDTAADISYKIKECKDVYGVVGVFTSWFFIEQELKLFALGRLQYDIRTYELEDYHLGDYTLTKGDTMYSCHIPSAGPLREEDCIASFKKAYEFFGGAKHKGGILPIHCQSWLLYPPYIEKVYIEGSNVKKFARMFDIIKQIERGNEFSDCWRVFNKMYEGTSKGLPDDNSLRRNMINYIDDYGVFGIGEGIILFDGEKIINCKN